MTKAASREVSFHKKLFSKLFLSILIGAVFAWLAAQGGVPLIPSEQSFRAVVWWTVPTYAGLLLCTHFVRASRWRFLIAPVQQVPLKECVLLNWIGFFAIFALPFRLGELARPALTKARRGIPVSAGMGTVAVERVVDGLVMSLCVAWALFALRRQPSDDPLVILLPTYGALALGVFSSAFFALGVFLWKRDLAVALTERVFGLVNSRLGAVISEKVAGIATGLLSVGDFRLFARFMAETLMYWSANAFGMWLLAWGCGLPLHFGHAVALMGILAIGILLPTGPGLFGNFQLAILTALKLYLPFETVSESGAVYIFLLYVVQSLVITTAGLIPLYALRIPFAALIQLHPKTANEP
ncbi:MAG: lysylphosphatidylglycerol synthase transmembrane domain-containing protein [Myxococcota bacterium]